jgi:hypothetical protein
MPLFLRSLNAFGEGRFASAWRAHHGLEPASDWLESTSIRLARSPTMKIPLFAASLLFAFSACASDPKMREADRLELYRANAGASVDNFQYFGRLDGWTPLGETALAIWTRPSEAYLLELTGTCHDLDFAQAITVTNQFGKVYRRFDKVIVLGRGANQIPCWIRDIRPINVKALKQAEKDKRAADTAARES